MLRSLAQGPLAFGRIPAFADVLITLVDHCRLTSARTFATHGVADTDQSKKPGGLARFYKNITIKEAFDQGGYQILLDGRVLKTPGKRPLILPNKTLALAVAAEWEWQAQRIQPFTMPLMSLAATAIDQPQDRDAVIETMLQYLPTDPVVCRPEHGSPLAAIQAAKLDPLLQWVVAETGAVLVPSTSIFGADIPEEQVQKIKTHLEGLDRWHLTAAEQLASACKSVIVGLALVKEHISLETALEIARLEEDFQIEEWGLVEGGHDVDIADVRVRVAAPHVFVRLMKT